MRSWDRITSSPNNCLPNPLKQILIGIRESHFRLLYEIQNAMISLEGFWQLTDFHIFQFVWA